MPDHSAVSIRPTRGGKAAKRASKDYEPLLADSKDEEDSKKPGLSWGRLCAEARIVRCRMVVGTVFLFLSSASNLALPALFGIIIDALARKDQDSLNVASIALVVVTICGALFAMIRAFLFNSSGQIVVAGLRSKLFGSLMALEVGFFDATKTGELISRLASDTAVLKDAVTTNISMAIRWVATALGGTIYLFVLSWKLALVMVAVIPVIAISSVVYGRYVRSLSKDAQKALADASEVAEETFSSIRTVRSFVGEPKQTKHYDESIATTLDIGIRNAWAGGVFIGITTAVSSCSFIGIVYYGGQLVIQGDITEGILTAFLLYAIQIGGALGGLAGLFGSIMSAMGANDRVFKLLDRVPKMPVSGEGARPDSFSGQIELDNVHFAYPTRPDAPVLKGLALKVNPGEVHALVGSSGGGKSTVVNLIERFYDVQSGSVKLDGRDVRELDPSWVRAQMGLVRQEPTLFGCSIRENIAFGRSQATDEEIEAAARLANAHDFVSDFPDGYDTIVGEKGVRLSGGQKQRIAIAAATLSGVSDTGPKVLLLDEATSALDSESEHLVQTALERLMVGRTTLIVAHRLSTVRSADVVHVVHGGKVVASGSHDELIRTSALYSALVKRQLSGLSGPAPAAAAGDIEDEALALDIAAEEDAAASSSSASGTEDGDSGDAALLTTPSAAAAAL